MNSTEFFPAQVEQKLIEVTNRISNSPRVRQGLELERDQAKRALEVAKAKALLNASGTVDEKRAQVVMATVEEQAAYDRAHVAFRYAENMARTLENEQSAWQSVLRSVLSTYGAAGHGR